MNETIERTIASWPQEPRESAGRLMETYGEPDEHTESFLIWHEKAKPWKRTILSRETHRHDFPSAHQDMVQQYIDYRIPPEKVGDVLAYDGSVAYERTKGELSARCGGTSLNFLAINLAAEVATGSRTVEEARHRYAEVAERYHNGDEDPYTKEFQFPMQGSGTADPDEPVG